MKIQDLKHLKLPDKPGVYIFKKGKTILYIGKATSLRGRTKSYFSKDLVNMRGPRVFEMIDLSDRVEWSETESVLEALILEANLIKKHQPKYNAREKDNRSFNYVAITKEKLPKILVIRGRSLKKHDIPLSDIFGPFPNGNQLKEALKIVRRIFPFMDAQSVKKNNYTFYKQIGLVPDMDVVELIQYKKNIRNIKLLFQGKKKSVLINLKKQMAAFSKSKDFEKAAIVRDQIFALNHINDVALIKEESLHEEFEMFRHPHQYESEMNFPTKVRVEAYDIAHMSGKSMVGVMTVVEKNEINKNEYRKFIIRTKSKADDTGALEEVLARRLRHFEWGLPNLLVVDGSTAQINVAKRVLDRYQLNIPVVSVVKDERHKAKAIMGKEEIIKKNRRAILLANSEAHRFAIAFHKHKRNKIFLSDYK